VVEVCDFEYVCMCICVCVYTHTHTNNCTINRYNDKPTVVNLLHILAYRVASNKEKYINGYLYTYMVKIQNIKMVEN